MLLDARHVPERPCGGLVYLGRYNKINVHLCLFLFANKTANRTTQTQQKPKGQQMNRQLKRARC